MRIGRYFYIYKVVRQDTDNEILFRDQLSCWPAERYVEDYIRSLITDVPVTVYRSVSDGYGGFKWLPMFQFNRHFFAIQRDGSLLELKTSIPAPLRANIQTGVK